MKRLTSAVCVGLVQTFSITLTGPVVCDSVPACALPATGLAIDAFAVAVEDVGRIEARSRIDPTDMLWDRQASCCLYAMSRCSKIARCGELDFQPIAGTQEAPAQPGQR